ncbi:MAG: folate family ECF transporter S component [Clostridia bacterium]|nr:folate family ECF transporter S component [Clostridia bacterium]
MNGSKAVRKLCLTAMLMALSVVVGIICKNFFTWNVYYRVTFENFPIILTGLCFGPIYGLAAGVGADIISCLCSTNPAVNPLISLGAATVGLVSGLVPMLFINRKDGKGRKAPVIRPMLAVLIAELSAQFLGQWLIKSVAKKIFFAMPDIGFLIGLGFTCVVAPIEFFLIRAIIKNKSVSSGLKDLCDYDLF